MGKWAVNSMSADAAHQRTVEQVGNVPVPPVNDETVDVTQISPQTLVQQRTVEQVADVQVPRVVEQIAEVAAIIPQERPQQLPVPQAVNEQPRRRQCAADITAALA